MNSQLCVAGFVRGCNEPSLIVAPIPPTTAPCLVKRSPIDPTLAESRLSHQTFALIVYM